MRSLSTLILIPVLLLWTSPGFAQDDATTEQKGLPPFEKEEIAEMSQEELMAIVQKADAFFIDQGVENIAVDVDVFRDPAHAITLDDMKSGAVDIKATLSPIIAHYFFSNPGWYQLKIMGIVIATSEPGVPTYTHMLPLPGGQLNIPEVMDNYDMIYLGKGEVNGRETYRIRFAARHFKEQFMKYSIYDFDVEKGYIARVESHADDGHFWRGNGYGEFYYSQREGKLLPAYGHGEIFIFPFFKAALWGRWYKWEFNSDNFDELLNRGNEDAFVPIVVNEEPPGKDTSIE